MTTLCRFLFVLWLGVALVACRKDAKPSQSDYNSFLETKPATLKPITRKVSDAVGGYYEGLPYYYNNTTKTYPLLIFLAGGGQMGNGKEDLPLLKNDGIVTMQLENKLPPNFLVDGKNFSFITLTPQFSHYPLDAEVQAFVTFAKKNYRVDPSRVYMSGLSMGGVVTANVGSSYTSELAAIVPMSGVSSGTDLKQRCNKIAAGALPVWVFHNAGDPLIGESDPINFVAAINTYKPLVKPRLTLFNEFKHDAWTQALDTGYRENGLNIYEWMLHFKR